MQGTKLDTDLFGEPACTAALSQFFTPMWLAKRAARWIPPTIDGVPTRVLEPSAGRGNLMDGWLRFAGAERERQITACEVDARWFAFLKKHFPRAHLYHGDFLEWHPLLLADGLVGARGGLWDVALQNPPYEDGQDVEHVAKALELCGRAVEIVKSDFEFSAARDKALWSRARVTRRALCVDRPDFGGTMEKSAEGPSRNYVVLELVSADQVGGAYDVREERWRRDDPEDRW